MTQIVPQIMYPYPHPHPPPPLPSPPPSQNNGLMDRLKYIPFLGLIDPIVLLAIVAIPIIALLGIHSLIMPLVPIAIYLLSIFFPIGASGKRRKKRYITDDNALLNQINDNFNNALTRYEVITNYNHNSLNNSLF